MIWMIIAGVFIAAIVIAYVCSNKVECPRCESLGGWAQCHNGYCRRCCEKCYADNYGCEHYDRKRGGQK